MWRSNADNGDWEFAVYEGTDVQTWNKLWFATALNDPDERRITVPFDVDAEGDRIVGFHLRSPHGSVGYAVVDDVELVAVARPAARTDLVDYLPEDLSIEIASGAQLLLDFDGEAKVGKVSYDGLRSVGGKALVGEISYRRFPTLIKGRGRLYVEPRGCVILVR